MGLSRWVSVCLCGLTFVIEFRLMRKQHMLERGWNLEIHYTGTLLLIAFSKSLKQTHKQMEYGQDASESAYTCVNSSIYNCQE